MTVKAGVIGVGHLGQHHARIYSELEAAELTAVADSNRGRAEEIASRYGARAYADYRDMLGEVGAVSVAAPTSSHFGIAMDCLRAGIDVLVEKPITVEVAEADALIEEAERLGRVLQVGHLERFNPAVMELEGLIDQPEFIESERVSPFLGRSTDVDVTLDLMIHDIDIIMSLMSPSSIKDIRVMGARVLTDKIDLAKAWLEFENGVDALITASRIAGDTRRLLKLYQRDSFVVLDYRHKKILKHLRTPGGISEVPVEVQDREPLREEIADFLDCVSSRRRPRVSGVEGREALRVAMRISDMIREAGVKK
ncbi:MAG: Gfo/Idh/MocA family oxidoreductase [Nitrospirota bacterium]